MGVGDQPHASADLSPEKIPVFIAQPQGLYDQEVSPRYPSNRTLGSLHFLPGVEPRFIGLVGHSLINTPFTLSRLLPQEL